ARAGDGWTVRAGGDGMTVDAVVLACPAHAAADLLAPLDTTLADALAGIVYASAAILSLGVRTSDLPDGPPGFGVVVPASDGRDILACTFSSRKWSGRAPERFELLRAFVGGIRRPDLVERDDDALVATVRHELNRFLGLVGRDVVARVDRWPQA